MDKKMIDCTVLPRGKFFWCSYYHKGISQVPGRVDSIVEWDASRFTFYTPENPQNEWWGSGAKLLKAIQGRPLATANVLDFLLDNPDEIPEWLRNELQQENELGGGSLYFFGSIGKVGVSGSLSTEYLTWGKPKSCFSWPFLSIPEIWYSEHHLLDYRFQPDIKIAVWKK